MKKYLVFILTLFILTSCANDTPGNLSGTSEILSNCENKITDDTAHIQESSQVSVNGDGSSSTGCQVHGVEYHAIPNSLVNYIGNSAAVAAWLADVTKNTTTDGCSETNASIYDFIVYFKIPKSVLIELYNDQTMRYDYPNDLLYSGTAEEIDTYYRTTDEDKELKKIKWSNLNELKMDLAALIRDKTGESIKYREHSVVELAKLAGISEKRVTQYRNIKSANKRSE